MYCRKCGTKISDDSEYCNKCGTKVEKPIDTDNSTQNVQPTEKPEPTEVPEMTEEKLTQKHRKETLKLALLAFISVIMLVLIVVIEELTCRIDFCFNPRVNGTYVCNEHMCEYPKCNRGKYTKEIYGVEQLVPYCILHICCERNCTEMTDEGVSFCKYHKCIVEDCNEKHMPGSEYCSSHANEW